MNDRKNSFTEILLIFILSLLIQQSIAKQRSMDSLLTILNIAKEDTNKINTLNAFGWEYDSSKPDTAFLYYNQALALSEKINFKKGKANALRLIAGYYLDKGNNEEAMKNYNSSLKIYEETNDKKGIAKVMSNIGLLYTYQANFPKALEYYFKALKMNEELGDKSNMAKVLANIGIVYVEQANYPKALEYDFKSLKIAEELGAKRSMAIVIGNIGSVYYAQSNYTKALEYDFKALKMVEELGDKYSMANLICNIGNGYIEQSNYPKALEYYFKSLKISEELEAKSIMANVIGNIGNVYIKTKKYKDAEKYLDRALALSKEIGELNTIEEVEKYYSKLDSARGNYQGALMHYKEYITARDSMFNRENTKKQTQHEMNYEFEKKEAATKAEQDKKDALAKEEADKQKLVRNSFIGGFALVLLLAGVATRGYRQKQKANKTLEQKNITIEKQKHEVEKQKDLVEEKQKEIVDSINYARRIQYTLLADEALLKSNLPEHFILFKPKDIVSGDFYWATKKDNRFYLAVCDSTGHGVPGAFMSVLNSSFLNEAINEKNIVQPHLILNYVREKLIMSVSADGGQDGMDCTLICIENNMEMITYASANNKPIHISNGELIELEANKMPVGKGEKQDSFTSFRLALQKNDTVYFFTDGFADQFGGENGAKKLTKKKFKELLFSIKDKSMQELGIALDTFITDYRKDIEQIDDILVIGVRV